MSSAYLNDSQPTGFCVCALAVIWGVASVQLSEVLGDPAGWGEKKLLQLGGHRLQGLGALLEVQLFLSTVSKTGLGQVMSKQQLSLLAMWTDLSCVACPSAVRV